MAWRERAISKSLGAARSRAEERLQRYLNSALVLIDERGSTEFIVQEVVKHAGLSTLGLRLGRAKRSIATVPKASRSDERTSISGPTTATVVAQWH